MCGCGCVGVIMCVCVLPCVCVCRHWGGKLLTWKVLECVLVVCCCCCLQAQRQAKPSPSIPPWEVPKKANPPPPSSTAASTAGAPSHSAAAAASAGDVKRAIAASLPGRKGPLFGGSSRSSSRSHQGGSSAAPDGLEPLQQLIPPDIARLRLQVMMPHVVSGPRTILRMYHGMWILFVELLLGTWSAKAEQQ
jgi:hypothetical protein